jgi:hypothetical protein
MGFGWGAGSAGAAENVEIGHECATGSTFSSLWKENVERARRRTPNSTFSSANVASRRTRAASATLYS